MRRLVFTIIPLLVLLPALRADDQSKKKPKEDKPSTPAAQLRAMKAELEKALEDAKKAVQDAADETEREKIRTDFRKKASDTAGRMLAFAEKNIKDAAAAEALITVLELSQEDKTRSDKAVDLLLKHHANNEEVNTIFEWVGFLESPGAEKLCTGLIDRSSNKKLQAYASYSQAQILQKKAKEVKGTEADNLAKEAEALLDTVATKYKNIAEDLADKAEENLFVLRHLSIGKEPLDISGEDSDGKKFKLSDYRGKVVVLDFWANW